MTPKRASASSRADEGDEVFLHASALPADRQAPKPGAKVEFSVADGRRGPSAMAVTILEPAPSIAQSQRKPTDDMTVIVEDLIKMLDGVSNVSAQGPLPRGAPRASRSPRCSAPSPNSWTQ